MKNFIFDIDGVLVNHKIGDVEYIAQRFNVDVDKAREVYSGTDISTIATSDYDLAMSFYSHIVERLGEEGLTSEDFALEWCEHNSEIYEENISLVKELRADGRKVFTGTNQGLYRAEYILGQMKFRGLFDGFYASSSLGFYKPQLGFYNAILDKEKLDPSETVFIDDKLKNVEAAEEVGMRSIHYTHGEMNLKEEIGKLLND